MKPEQKPLAKQIGAGARAARLKLKLTQEDVAELIQLSPEFYARIERGHALPSIGTFMRISSVLAVSADVLLGNVPSADSRSADTGLARPWINPTDSPELRRLVRRLRRASQTTLRLVSLLLKEIERTMGDFHDTVDTPSSNAEGDQAQGGSLPSSQQRPYVREGAVAH